MSKIALLVIDVQNSLLQAHPYNELTVIKNIKDIIKKARDNSIEVIYVRHDDGIGSDLEHGTDGWQICKEISPIKNELIVEKKYNSSFHKTNLHEELQSKGIDTLILMGLQIEYCIDATIKSAFDHEYKIFVPEETNTTFTNEYFTGENIYKFYNFKIWNNRFASVVSMEKILDLLK